jgi:hypothetical protein
LLKDAPRDEVFRAVPPTLRPPTLFISEAMVKTHLPRIYANLGVKRSRGRPSWARSIGVC